MKLTIAYIIKCLLCGISILQITSAVRADILSSGFQAEFDVYKNETYLGVAKRKLAKAENGDWSYQSEMKPKGFVSLFVSDVINEKSLFKQTRNQIIPYQYKYDQTGGKREKHYQIDFNWENMTGTNLQQKQSIPLQQDSQDLLTFQLQIMKHLQSSKSNLDLHIVTRKDGRVYKLSLVENEKLETPLGTFTTLVLSDNMHYKIWSAPSIEYLPIKIQKTEDDGDVIEIVIRSFTL